MTKSPSWLALVAAVALPPALALRSSRIERRLEVERDRADALAGEVARLREACGGVEEARKIAAEARGALPHVDEAIGRLEARLREERARIEALEGGADCTAQGGRETFEAVRSLDATLDGTLRRVEGIGAGVEGLSRALDEESRERRAAVESIAARVARDPALMEAGMIDPTVQLAGEETVGSGVVVHARAAPGGSEAFVLTAYHVVRNIQSEGGNPSALRIYLYSEGGGRREVTGALLAHEEGIDVALLRFVVDGPPPRAARIAPRARVAAIPVFTPVYTVGCPLGNDPIPTAGEIASTRSAVGSESYWMINAPAYFGNSGGGVFLAETRELVGLYSKIYTHGRGRPTVISHMGLVTPIDRALDFLEKGGFGFISPESPAAELASGSRSQG
ncbi:MAG TPA: trypsin-like peptidase domain-containing protein [Planctomycetota bacterium]|nr:trypsin-like peptidase domain-containing protein [Planctomycetota bacterium]